MPSKKKKTDETQLVDLWFHTFDNSGNIEKQGRVIGSATPEVYIIQHYDFVLGDPSHVRLVRLDEMLGWVFYFELDDMRDAWENRRKRP